MQKCSFFEGEEAVLFSPYTRETLLCDRVVLHYLDQLAQNQRTDEAWQKLALDDTNRHRVCATLVAMNILKEPKPLWVSWIPISI